MNAHHKKRSHRPSPPPTSPTYFTAGHHGYDASAYEESSRLYKAIARVPFGWQLDVTVSASEASTSQSLPSELEELIRSYGQYQYIPDVNLGDLIAPSEFRKSYLSQGHSLCALSIDNRDGGDIVSIDGRGRLFLSVSKDTYELLGLTGRPSRFGTLNQRFIIEIDTRADGFLSGKPGFEKTISSLRKWPNNTPSNGAIESLNSTEHGKGRTWEIVITLVGSVDKALPTTLDLPPGNNIKTKAPTLSSSKIRKSLPNTDSVLKGPSTASSQLPARGKKRRLEENDWDEEVASFQEWVGSVALGFQPILQKEAEIAATQFPIGETIHISANGFWHPDALQALTRKLIGRAQSDPAIHFVHIALHRAPSAPISHTSAKPALQGTRKRPNGKKAKRGRGRGEEEERDLSLQCECAWDILSDGSRWAVWERQ